MAQEKELKTKWSDQEKVELQKGEHETPIIVTTEPKEQLEKADTRFISSESSKTTIIDGDLKVGGEVTGTLKATALYKHIIDYGGKSAEKLIIITNLSEPFKDWATIMGISMENLYSQYAFVSAFCKQGINERYFIKQFLGTYFTLSNDTKITPTKLVDKVSKLE